MGAYACDGQQLLRCTGDPGGPAPERTCFGIERCDAGRGECAPACRPGEIYVPATGSKGFVMGAGFTVNASASRIGKGHRPGSDRRHSVVLSRPFCIDATEVTVAAVVKCIAERGCEKPSLARRFATYPTKVDHPVNAYSWRAARFFCEQYGKSLPTEAQWEWAATGGDERAYPWGAEPPTCERADFTPGELPHPAADAGCHGGGPSAVGSHPSGAKEWPAGKIHDLAGNVWEWCLDNYEPYPERQEVDPLHKTLEDGPHVVRGGGWNRSAAGINTRFRGGARVDYMVPGLGFRCVRNALDP